MVFPYGSVSIPDKWEKTNYNSVSKQQFFKNEEGVFIAIAFAPCNKYEFNSDNSKKGFDFVKAFYKWDSEYYANTYGFQQDLIEENEEKNYIVWRIYGEYNNSYLDTYLLFGERGGFANNFSVMKTDKWTVEKKIAFLKSIYENKKE